MFDEAANQIGEHRVPVLAGAAQFGSSLEVSHKISVAVAPIPPRRDRDARQRVRPRV
jgi:hypothetical protein